MMPLYDVKCPACGKEEERLAKFGATVYCSGCGVQVQRLVRPSRVIIFKPRWFEHFGPQPIHVESKKQLKRLCKEHKVTSKYLEDG